MITSDGYYVIFDPYKGTKKMFKFNKVLNEKEREYIRDSKIYENSVVILTSQMKFFLIHDITSEELEIQQFKIEENFSK